MNFFFQSWKRYASKNIASNELRGHKGDFIATVTRQDPKDIRLRKVLCKHLEQTLEEDKFFHEPITLSVLTENDVPTLPAIVNTSHFWFSDHSRFWYHLEQGAEMFNAGAVLLTDTAYLRGHMEKCFHRQCDDYENIQEPQNSLKFLSEVTQALVLTVFELTMPQGSTCNNELKPDDVNDELTTELEEIINNGIEDRVDTNLVIAEDDDDIGNEQLTSEVPSIPIKTHQMNMRHYQPYFQGTQINVETLNIINDEVLTKSLLERLLYKKRKNSPMILSVKTEEL